MDRHLRESIHSNKKIMKSKFLERFRGKTSKIPKEGGLESIIAKIGKPIDKRYDFSQMIIFLHGIIENMPNKPFLYKI